MTEQRQSSAQAPGRNELEERIAELERENAALRQALPAASPVDALPPDQCDDDSRNQFEQEIIESRNVVRALIDASDDYFALVDEHSIIHACNLAWSRAVDAHPRQLVGRNLFDFIPEQVRDAVHTELEESIRENKPKAFTLTRDNLTFDCRINPLGSSDNSSRMFTFSAHDISPLLQAEKLQQEMELRYKTVFDSAGDAIFIHDLQGFFLDANLVFRELLGYSLDQIRQFTLQDLVARTDNPPDMLGDATDMLTFQVELMREDGHVLPLDVSARRITFDNKPALLCIGRDITQRRRVESILLKAKDAAESNVRMQNEFVANISHELRTPLSSIIGITELLSLSELDDAQRRNLDRIAYSADMLRGLINDLLDLSRLESSTFSMASQPFSLLELMRETSNIFLEKVASKNLNFSYTVSEDVPEFLRGDPMRLKQVLFNIVGNAIKFTADGSVRMTVTLARDVRQLSPDQADAAPKDAEHAAPGDDGVTIAFEIADTGIGMAPVDLQRIFNRFTQGDNTAGRAYGGAGLGLSISRQLIRLMNGDISASSEPGHGSTFRFYIRLPRATALAVAEQLAAGEAVDVSPARVLLVEDNRINREMITAMIELDGHEVRTAADGLEALKALENFTPDVIFMDLQMPRCDGYEATRRIRALENPRLAATPIVALSAHAQKPPEEEWRKTGMDAHLSKPIQLATIREAIAAITSDRETPRQKEQDESATSDGAVLDLEILRDNMGHNEDLVRLACEKFLSHAAGYMDDLQVAVKNNDRNEVKRIAHSFKSVAGTIGAEQARQEALTIEKEAPTAAWGLLSQHVSSLREMVDELRVLVAEAVRR
ncbi:response regulator [Oceanidesulfovibrio marinus]|uniref:histidine kinase n=1 Tax=Oceanidesulfovibrio marinus TaxID=370038 RepID=A0A6P1ZDB0_9BACT|nr:response regulator [Oceanidesulfovibrio marinus]TVM31736.1 hypothetical protein DQK91_17525 [Oceanidesulfovibrio marinus]